MTLDALDVATLTTGNRALSRVTILGDAAHKTTTHTGMGATAALQDAEHLATLLKSNASSLKLNPAVLREYEAGMIERAREVVSGATGMTARLHTVHSPVKLAVIEWIMWTVGWVATVVSPIVRLIKSRA